MSTSVLSLFPFSSFCSIGARALCEFANVFSSDNSLTMPGLKMPTNGKTQLFAKVQGMHRQTRVVWIQLPQWSWNLQSQRFQGCSYLRTQSYTAQRELQSHFSGLIKWNWSLKKILCITKISIKEFSMEKVRNLYICNMTHISSHSSSHLLSPSVDVCVHAEYTHTWTQPNQYIIQAQIQIGLNHSNIWRKFRTTLEDGNTETSMTSVQEWNKQHWQSSDSV